MNVALVESLLHGAGVDLDRVCAQLRLPRDGWAAFGPLRQFVQALAVQQLAAELKLSDTEFGWVIAAFALGYALW